MSRNPCPARCMDGVYGILPYRTQHRLTQIQSEEEKNLLIKRLGEKCHSLGLFGVISLLCSGAFLAQGGSQGVIACAASGAGLSGACCLVGCTAASWMPEIVEGVKQAADRAFQRDTVGFLQGPGPTSSIAMSYFGDEAVI